MQLVIELDGLVQRFGRLVPDGAGLLERVAEIRAQASPPHPRLEVALARFGAGGVSDLQRDLAALGLDAAVAKLKAALVSRTSAADLRASADTATGVMLLAGRHSQARAAMGAGMPAYVVSDRQPADHWHLFLQEVPRVVAESVRLAVPRPLSDAARRGTLIAVREGGVAAARVRSTEVLRRDLRADWLTIGEWQVVYVENDPASAMLLALPGAHIVADDVHVLSLGVAKDAHSRPDAIIGSAQYALVRSPQPVDLRWTHARHARFGASEAPTANDAAPLPSFAGRSLEDNLEQPAPALDFGGAESRDAEPLQAFAIPYGNVCADRILVITMDEDNGRARAVSIALALRERMGGDAVLVCSGDARPHGLLWQAELNCLRAIIQLHGNGDSEISEIADDSLPDVPLLTVSASSRAADWPALAERIACRLR